MQTLKLTAKDFKKSDNYWSDYIGSKIESGFDGHIEIEGNLGYVKFISLSVKGHIIAAAGTGIEAGWGIEAGLTVSCKLTLKVAYRIFAGICFWRKTVNDEDKTITCGKFEGGDVAYGILKETGLPDEKKESLSGKKVKVVVDGKEYDARIE